MRSFHSFILHTCLCYFCYESRAAGIRQALPDLKRRRREAQHEDSSGASNNSHPVQKGTEENYNTCSLRQELIDSPVNTHWLFFSRTEVLSQGDDHSKSISSPVC